MYTKMLGIAIAVVMIPAIVLSEPYVCEDTSKPVETRFLTWFFKDPTYSIPSYCRRVADANYPQQEALILATRPDYLKLSITDATFGLAVEKTQAEKDVVDAAIAAKAAEKAALATERANNIFCNQQDVNAGTNAIAARKTALYAQIDALPATTPPTRATLVASLKAVVDELATISTLTVNCFTGRKPPG